MAKSPIPKDISSQVIYNSDSTCCKCRVVHKGFQIHHIDSNDNNNDINNLALLCLDCHNQTLVRGGFTRQLLPEVVTKYRDTWLDTVLIKRQSDTESNKKTKSNLEKHIVKSNNSKTTSLSSETDTKTALKTHITRVKMKPGCNSSNNLLEIDEFYIEGRGHFKKTQVHDQVKLNPGSIKVNIHPYQNVIPAISIHGEKS